MKANNFSKNDCTTCRFYIFNSPNGRVKPFYHCMVGYKPNRYCDCKKEALECLKQSYRYGANINLNDIYPKELFLF